MKEELKLLWTLNFQLIPFSEKLNLPEAGLALPGLVIGCGATVLGKSWWQGVLEGRTAVSEGDAPLRGSVAALTVPQGWKLLAEELGTSQEN